MVKYIKFKNSNSGVVHKISEREYEGMRKSGEPMQVVKSVTRKRRSNGLLDFNFDFRWWIKMTILRRNKKGRFSDRLSRSKEPWERGRGAKKKGNPSYKPSSTSKGKRYKVRGSNWWGSDWVNIKRWYFLTFERKYPESVSPKDNRVKFSVIFNEQELEMLVEIMKFLEQPKPSTAIKQWLFYAWIANVRPAKSLTYLRDTLFKNERNNKRLGIPVYEEIKTNVLQKLNK